MPEANTVPMSPKETAQMVFGGTYNPPAARASVPSQAPQQQMSGDDFSKVLSQLVKPIDPNLVTAAMTPISGGHDVQMPLSVAKPIPDFQPAPLDRREVVGKGNARAQGIGNAITGTMNAVGKISTVERQKKQIQLATVTQRLIEAQNSIDTAQQVLKEDPSNAAAKEALEHNTQVREGLLSDAKTRKAIQKGFQIDFTDPSNNKTEEHAGVQQGIQLAKKSYGEQFQNQMPEKMMPNVLAQQKLQLAQQQQMVNQRALQAFSTYAAAAQRANATVNAAQIRELGQNARTQAVLETKWEMQTRALNAAQSMLKYKFGNEFALISARAKAATQSAKDIWDYKTTDMNVLQQKWQKSDVDYGKAIEAANTATANILNQMALNKDSISKDANLAKDYQQALSTAKETVLQLTAQREASKKNAQLLFGSAVAGDTNATGTGFNPNSIGSYASGDPTSILNEQNADQDYGEGVDINAVPVT